MTGGVARGMDPTPPRHVRNLPISPQRLEVIFYVIRFPPIKTSDGRHHSAADGWIRWRIRLASIQVRQLKPMGIDRCVPFINQMLQRTGMIEMRVRHNNRGGPGTFAEALFRRPSDHSGGTE